MTFMAVGNNFSNKFDPSAALIPRLASQLAKMHKTTVDTSEIPKKNDE